MLPWRASTGWPPMARSTRTAAVLLGPALAGGGFLVLLERGGDAGAAPAGAPCGARLRARGLPERGCWP